MGRDDRRLQRRHRGRRLNPFVHYRERLGSYRQAIEGGRSDEWFVETVDRLDEAVARVWGHGFLVTPVTREDRLARAAGLDVELWVKDETGNVSGSHKARHLFATAIHLLVEEELGAAPATRLAIASCGNAALGAGVVARALDRELAVFVPTWADADVVDRLTDLGADVRRCDRRAGEAGDPAYLRCREAIAAGARSFGVQGTDTPTTFDGSRTIGWELTDQIEAIDSIYLQVGGGALATGVGEGAPGARLHPVQAAGCAPLRRAWDLLAPDFDFGAAAADPDAVMWPWTDPTSIATGILDDITYDWLPLLRATKASGGEPVVAPEATVQRAHELARRETTIPVCTTGSAGLAGLMTAPPPKAERVVVIFTGVDRTADPAADRNESRSDGNRSAGWSVEST